MEGNNTEKARTVDFIRHYLASAFIYGTILIFMAFCPAYVDTLEDTGFDYTTFFTIYFVGYLVLAPLFYALFKPQTVLQSRSLTIFGYFARQFRRNQSTEYFLQNLSPTEEEKNAFMILFIQTFFGIYSINLLCNSYLPSLGYNLDFLKVMFSDAMTYISGGNGIMAGIMQFLIDTGDMWIRLTTTITLIVLSLSYLTELDIFKNRIKSTDTTPLGIISCIACYYPVTILTDKFLHITDQSLLPVNNTVLLAILNLLAIIANIGIMIAVIRLGAKSGNLTNRGIVTGFPYNIVRHPDYAMQILYIIITTIPLYMLSNAGKFDKTVMTVATLGWILLYLFRAITEERHLIKDPDYQKYVEKVKYRFIPKLF
ncbi:hypothetical protein IJ541_11095 [bacterium]|nr:hypothetical protein [bacterium]